MFLLFQVSVVVALVACFWRCQADLRRRNRESWQSLTTELERWPEKASAPWSRFQRARVLLEMADYAERNNGPASELLQSTQIDLTQVDDAFLASFRTNAREARLSALADVLKSAIPARANERA